MRVRDLLTRLREKGITVTRKNGNLRIRANNPETINQFLPELKEKKQEILAYLVTATEQKPDERTRRLNNLIAEFMEDGDTKEEAMMLARVIVDKGRIAPCEAGYKEASIKYAYADCPVSEEITPLPYDEKALIRYFLNEGWTEQSAIALAKGLIERGSRLTPEEHLKYLECEKQENES